MIESAGLFLIFIVQILLLRNHKQILISNYLISYALLRFFCEFLRGDSARGFIGFLSISQWISVAVVVILFIILKAQSFRNVRR